MACDLTCWPLEELTHDASEGTSTPIIYIYIYIYIILKKKNGIPIFHFPGPKLPLKPIGLTRPPPCSPHKPKTKLTMPCCCFKQIINFDAHTAVESLESVPPAPWLKSIASVRHLHKNMTASKVGSRLEMVSALLVIQIL